MTKQWYTIFLSWYYIIALAMVLSALFALTVLLIKRSETVAKPFVNVVILYLTAVICQFMVVVYTTFLQLDKVVEHLDAIYGNFFNLVEFLCFNLILSRMLKGELVRSVARKMQVIYGLAIIMYWVFSNGFFLNPNKLALITTVYLLFLCLIYFYELFRFPPTKKLVEEPAFWIASGMLFYLVAMIPRLVFLQLISFWEGLEFRDLDEINFLASTLLYFTFIKATLCKAEANTFSLSS